MNVSDKTTKRGDLGLLLVPFGSFLLQFIKPYLFSEELESFNEIRRKIKELRRHLKNTTHTNILFVVREEINKSRINREFKPSVGNICIRLGR